METSRVRGLTEQAKGGVQRTLRAKPALWTGIAAGAGFVAGIAGRILRRRLRRRAVPAVIVIQAS